MQHPVGVLLNVLIFGFVVIQVGWVIYCLVFRRHNKFDLYD